MALTARQRNALPALELELAERAGMFDGPGPAAGAGVAPSRGDAGGLAPGARA